MALLFFPRGGSAQVARYMARALPRAGWDVRLLSGSLGALGDATNAETFFSGIDVRAVDTAPSREAPDSRGRRSSTGPWESSWLRGR